MNKSCCFVEKLQWPLGRKKTAARAGGGKARRGQSVIAARTATTAAR